MSKEEGADKTEPPTQKKIRDARKEGDVSKSKELTGTVILLGWVVGSWLLLRTMYGRMSDLFDKAFESIQQPFDVALLAVSKVAFEALVILCIPMLILALFMGVLTEFLQVGPIVAFKKMAPKLDKMNPVEGIKKMFSMDNLVELVKSVIKTVALLGIGAYVLWKALPDILQVPWSDPSVIGSLIWDAIVKIGVWTIFVFFFVSAVDVWYQKFSYTKKLRMSRRDIKQEGKENEGDPYIKSRRRQLHQEWSQQNMMNAVRGSNVVVTNPTHIAIAIQYEHGIDDLPIVVAKGEDYEAELIKKVAEEAGIPILQNIPLARGLNEKVDLDDYISDEFFEAVAEVLYWAETVRRDAGEVGKILMDDMHPDNPDAMPPSEETTIR